MKQEVAKARGRRGASQSPAIERTRTRPVFTPRADIYETEAAVTILTEMPGVKSDDIDIMLERGVLTIRGRAQEAAHEGYRQVYAEYADGDYERVFTLSEEIDRDNITANCANGVLSLELPKAKAAQVRRIKVASV